MERERFTCDFESLIPIEASNATTINTNKRMIQKIKKRDYCRVRIKTNTVVILEDKNIMVAHTRKLTYTSY